MLTEISREKIEGRVEEVVVRQRGAWHEACILGWDGEPLGAVLRVPSAEDHRGNIHVGGTCRKADVTARDREICRIVGPRLQADGLYFAGLDIIGDWVTEINVTSPTGIQEINRLDGVQLESPVIDWVEERLAARG